MRIEVSCRQPHFSQSPSPDAPAARPGCGPAIILLGRRLERVGLRRTHIGHGLPAALPVTLARMPVSS